MSVPAAAAAAAAASDGTSLAAVNHTRKRKTATNAEYLREKKRQHETRRQRQQQAEQEAFNQCRVLRDEWMAKGVHWGHLLLLHIQAAPAPSSLSSLSDDAPAQKGLQNMSALAAPLPLPATDASVVSESALLEAWQGMMRKLWSVFLYQAPYLRVNVHLIQRAVQFFEHDLWKEHVPESRSTLHALGQFEGVYQALVQYIKTAGNTATAATATAAPALPLTEMEKKDKKEEFEPLPPILEEFFNRSHGLFSCHRCGSRDVSFFNYSLCKGDEGMKIITRCLNKKCGVTTVS